VRFRKWRRAVSGNSDPKPERRQDGITAPGLDSCVLREYLAGGILRRMQTKEKARLGGFVQIKVAQIPVR
jgi:hypothetical protein